MLSDAGVFNERVPAEAINLGEISSASDYDPQINMSASMSPDYIQECLEAILASLPDNQRACAILWGEGYPIRSISRKLGVSPVAVNYTLAYTLGNITNSVNALSANGLPLFSMEPIPYFLWLLMNYYQYYQPSDPLPGSESSFSNILRVLMPGEASVFSADAYDSIYHGDYDSKSEPEPVNVSASRAAEPDTSFAGFTGEELDVSSFIRPESSKPDSGFEKKAEPPASDTDTPLPDVVVFDPHKKEVPEDDAPEKDPADTAEEGKDQAEESAEGSTGPESGKAPESSDETEKAAAAKPEDDAEETENTDSSTIKAAGAAGSTEGSDADKTAETAETAISGMEEKTNHDKMVDDILFGTLSQATSAQDKPKKHTGLIAALIVIIVILCLLIAAMFLFKEQVNKLLGINLFNTTQVTEPETTLPPVVEETTTEEPTTEAPTTQEPTTEAPTTEEPTTEEPTTADPGPEFDVTINLGDSALAMHATATNDEDRLLYIPAGEQVHISEVQDGWGRTTYDGETGWIWLEYTKVAGNARVQQPEEGTMLEQPEPYVMGLTEFGNELRMLPGSYSASFGQIPEGTEIMIEAYWEDTWAHSMYAYTSYDGHHGWVYLYSTADTQEQAEN